MDIVGVVIVSIGITISFMILTYFNIKDNFIVDIIMNIIKNINFSLDYINFEEVDIINFKDKDINLISIQVN